MDRHVVACLDVDLAVALVRELPLGALHGDGVAHGHTVEVLGHVALRIHLHEQLEEAHVVVRGDRGVRPRYRPAIDRRGKVYVLADWQPQYVLRRLQRKPENARVVGELLQGMAS